MRKSRAKFSCACGVVCAAMMARHSVFAAPPEVRGTWVTTTGLSTGTIKSPAAVITNFAALRNIGLNSIYMDCWRNGYTQFPSPTMQATIGVAKDPNDGSRDLLQETSIQAHRNGMAEIGWFQYGFSSGYGPSGGNPLTTYMKNQGWLLQDQAGNYYSSSDGNSYYWMNPAVPQVRTFLENIVLDAVKEYDLDGVQFDDRLAWPVNYGFDATTKNLYMQETGRGLPSSPTDANFVAWRSQQLTSFAEEFYGDLKKADPNLIISAAPGVEPDVYSSYCVDWPTWAKQTVSVNGVSHPLFDEIVPQVYSSTVSYFDSAWSTQQADMPANRQRDLGAGISINGSSGAYDWATVTEPQVNAVRAATQTEGHIWWYSDGVLNSDASQLTAYYNVAANGQASRPDQPANFRPLPIEASKVSGSSTDWTVPVGAKGRYQIIYTTSSTAAWSIFGGSVYFPGTIRATIAGATQVELLVDERPYNTGDANLDGSVDSSDFAILASHYGTTGNDWATGDFNGDGIVNALDFNALATGFGQPLAGATPSAIAEDGVVVPEPAAGMILLLAPLLAGRVRRATRRAI